MSDHDPRSDHWAVAREIPSSRRTLLVAGIGVTVAAGLSSCVIREPEAPQPPATQPPAATQSPDSANQSATSPPAPDEASPAAAKAADIPNGGGKILEKEKVVLTRDAGGQLRGFTAVCTHAGCLVTSVANGTINCPCHGSKFDATTGQPVAGPAKAPLQTISVRQSGDSIYLK